MRKFLSALALAAGVLACSVSTNPSPNADSLLVGTWTADTADIHISLNLDQAGCSFDPGAGVTGEYICTSLGQGSFHVMTPAVQGNFSASASYDHVPGELASVPYVQFSMDEGSGTFAGAALSATMPDSSHLVGEISPVAGVKDFVFGADSGITLTFTRQ
ncbi:MAG: hypothetical protein ACREOJ_04860 [Gemmatimonadaceae bacterium]